MRTFILTALLALPLAVHAEMPCAYSEPRNTDLDAAGLRHAVLNLNSSDLHIEGVAGLQKIEVRGIACASDRAWLKDLQLTAIRQGDTANVTADNAEHNSYFGLFGSHYAYLKLTVRVPAELASSIHSASGDVGASHLAALDFDSASGDLDAQDIAGVLNLKLGSADVDARQVGSVALHETGSGDVTIEGIKGDVHADQSGSGDLDFSHVGGSVSIGSAGSGDIKLREVTGNASIGSSGSGDVTANDIGGNFTVGANGSGEVRYEGVKGKVSVPKSDDDN